MFSFPLLIGPVIEATCDITFSAIDLTGSLWTDIAYCPSLGLWVAVGPTKAVYSSDGTNWNDSGDPQNFTPSAVHGSDTASWFFALGGSNAGAYSSDGINWTEFFSPSGQPNPNQLHCGNGVFVYLGSLDKIFISPSSAFGWSEVADTTGATFSGRGVGYSPDLDLWVMVGSTPTNTATDVYFTSSNSGVTWDQGTLPISSIWKGAVWNGRVWIVYAGAGGGLDKILSSTDGLNWTDITASSNFPSANWFSAASNEIGTLMINAIDVGSGVYCSQDDGITWTFIECPGASSDAFQGIASDGVSYGCNVSTGADDIYMSQV